MATVTRAREFDRSATALRVDAIGLTLLRLTAGVIMTAHGWQKVATFPQWQGTVEQLGLPMPEVAARLAIVGELGGGIALILGLLTPVAGLLILGVMATAIATVHAGKGLFSADGGWEFPLLLGMTALYFVARGGGPYSVDALIERRRDKSGTFGARRYARGGEPIGGAT